VKHLPDPTRTRGYGSGRVYPWVRVYPQTPIIYPCYRRTDGQTELRWLTHA